LLSECSFKIESQREQAIISEKDLNSQKAEFAKLRSKLRLLDSRIAIARSLEDNDSPKTIQKMEEEVKEGQKRIEEL